MVINKVHTNQKKEESSSSETSSEQVLINQKKFIRRPDLTADIRLELGIMGLSPAYRCCPIKDLKAKYKVSHTFIYNQSDILKKNASLLFGSSRSKQSNPLDEVLQSMRFFWKGS